MNEVTYCGVCSVETNGTNYCYLCYCKRRNEFCQRLLLGVLFIPLLAQSVSPRKQRIREIEIQLEQLHDEAVDMELYSLTCPCLLECLDCESREGFKEKKRNIYLEIEKLTRELLEYLID